MQRYDVHKRVRERGDMQKQTVMCASSSPLEYSTKNLASDLRCSLRLQKLKSLCQYVLEALIL